MAGIKHVYRSPDAFRFPTWDAAITYPPNSVVAYYDSEVSYWRHYISKVEALAGTLDSDVYLQYWAQFSFDSDTLANYAQQAVLNNFNALVRNIDSEFSVNYDSDMNFLYNHLDSELTEVNKKFNNLLDSEWVRRNISNSIALADLGADSDWVLRLFGTNVTFRLIGADSEWVLSQLPPVDMIDSEWVLSQIPVDQVDSEWVLNQIPEYQNDSDWIIQLVGVESYDRTLAIDSEAALRRVADDALSNRVTLLENSHTDSEWVLNQIPEYQNDSDWIIRYVTEQNRGADSDWVLRLIGDTLTWDSDIAYIRESNKNNVTEFAQLNDKDSDLQIQITDNDSDIFVNRQLIDTNTNRLTLVPIQLSNDITIVSLQADSELDITAEAIGTYRPEPFCYPDIKVFYSNQGNAHPSLAGRLLNGTKTAPLTGYRVEHNDSEISGIFINTNTLLVHDIRIVSTFRTQ